MSIDYDMQLQLGECMCPLSKRDGLTGRGPNSMASRLQPSDPHASRVELNEFNACNAMPDKIVPVPIGFVRFITLGRGTHLIYRASLSLPGNGRTSEELPCRTSLCSGVGSTACTPLPCLPMRQIKPRPLDRTVLNGRESLPIIH